MPLPTLLFVLSTLAPDPAGPGGVTVTPGDVDGNGSNDLVIDCNKKGQLIDIADVPGSPDVIVTWDGDGDGALGGPGDPFDNLTGPFELIDLRCGKGADVATLELEGPDDLGGGARRRVILVDLGPGSDSLVVNANGADFTAGGLTRIEIQGGAGKDDVTLDFDAAVDAAQVAVTVDLGDGDDELDCTLPHFLHDDSEFTLDATLGAGDDQSKVVIAALDVDTGSRIRIRTDGGTGDDDLLLQPSETVSSRALAGRFEYSAFGGTGKDLLSFNIASPHEFDFSQTGNGRLVVREDGGPGNDFVNFACMNGALDSPRYDVCLDGSSGNDSLLTNVSNPSTNNPLNYGAAGALLLIGGAGTDTATTQGNGLTRVIGVP